MKRTLRWVMIGAGITGLLATGAVLYLRTMLDGQHPSLERLFWTSTGKRPYYGRIQYRAPNARPPILEPRFVPAAEADLAEGSMVIGVFTHGAARAYPLHILAYHQVVNDVIGGQPITCTY